MDTNILTILAIITFVTFLLYALFSILKRKKESAFLNKLKALAETRSCLISSSDRWNNSIIGIDREQKYLFVIHRLNAKEMIQEINLLTIQTCQVVESSRVVGYKESSTKVVDKIELLLSNKDRTKADTSIEFYNTAFDSLLLAHELQVAEKWSKIVNDTLKG